MTKNKVKITAEPNKQELFITRLFDASRELVFKAYTDPKLIEQWLGPKDHTMKYEKYEPKSGGSWRYTSTDKKGEKSSFHGVIHDLIHPIYIIQTQEYEGLPEPGHVLLEFVKFEELPNNKTQLITHIIYQSIEDRDGMIQTGMERGITDSFDKLDDLLINLI